MSNSSPVPYTDMYPTGLEYDPKLYKTRDQLLTETTGVGKYLLSMPNHGMSEADIILAINTIARKLTILITLETLHSTMEVCRRTQFSDWIRWVIKHCDRNSNVFEKNKGLVVNRTFENNFPTISEKITAYLTVSYLKFIDETKLIDKLTDSQPANNTYMGMVLSNYGNCCPDNNAIYKLTMESGVEIARLIADIEYIENIKK